MKKHYDVVNEFLEVGVENVSEHLQWLSKRIIFDTVGDTTSAVHSVIYQPDDIPKGVWGEFVNHARVITINLEQHYLNSLVTVQDIEHMNKSIRTLITSELMDTIAHESWHAKKCQEMNDWDTKNLDEEGAKAHGETMWAYAERMDVNIKTFGTVIDDLLAKLYLELVEDVKEADCKEWKKIQLHMMDNNLNYFNPQTNIEIRTIREVFQSQVMPENQWINTGNDLYTPWGGNVTSCGVVTEPPVTTRRKVTEEQTTEPTLESASQVTETVKSIEPVAPVVEKPIVNTPVGECADYDPLSDIGMQMANPFDDGDITTNTNTNTTIVAPISIAQNNTTAVVANTTVIPVAPAVNVPIGQMTSATVVQPAGGLDVMKIQEIAEKVMRRIFHHVHSKCEFNTEGTFNNAGAVIEPINIADIEGHDKLFVEQDCLNSDGTFVSHMPVAGMIRGLITNEGLPQYRFYMSIGGVKHKRMFNVSKNNTTKVGGRLTSWAEKTRGGHRLMSLYNGTEKRTTASVELAPGQVLGQELFKIWEAKK